MSSSNSTQVELVEPSTQFSESEKQPQETINDEEKGESETAPDEALDRSLPLNWPTRKKFFNMAVPSVLCFVTSFGSSIYTPAIPDIMLAFNVSETLAILPLTTYVLSLSFSSMLSAPISETKGRMGTYRYAVPISAMFSIAAGFAPSFTALCVLRFFAGFFGSACLAVCAGTAADLFHPQDRALAASFVMYFPFLGPVVGPFVGGFVTQHGGWKWEQYTFAILTVVSYLPVFFLEETYLKIILARRRQKEETTTLEAEETPKPPASKLLLAVLCITLLRPMKMLVTEPIVAFLSLYVAFNFAVMFSLFASVPYIFEGLYGFNRSETGIVFLAGGLGCTLSIPTLIYLDRVKYQPVWRRYQQEGRGEVVAPELRLWSAMLGSFGMPVSLFCLAWTAKHDFHWIVPTLALVPFALCNLNIFFGACLYLIDTYAAMTAASAMAANGLLRYALGGVFPLFTIQMYEKLGIAWATSLLGFLSVAMVPIPWVLYKWGPEIRAKSRFETNEVEK